MRKTINQISTMKGQTPIVCLTAYSAPMARILDDHCDLLLVGDSVGMVVYGMDNTLDVDLAMMLNHGRAVVRNSSKACIVVDMPAGSYEDSPAQALDNARQLMKETGCDAVKLEGGQEMAKTISYMVKCGVPVMGHIGLLPQSVEKEGGYKIKGKTPAEEERLIADAKTLEKAGVFAIVIEGTIESVSRKITESITIPTIGIGASKACDGQVLVIDDMLGMFEKVPKFVKLYTDLKTEIGHAASDYASEVRARKFPDDMHVYRNEKT